MPGDAINEELIRQLSQLRGDSGGEFNRAELRSVVDSVMTRVHGSPEGIDHKLYEELVALARYIQRTKSELANLRAEEISGEHIPRATDELDAVVGATETATNTIMDQMEALDSACADLPDDKAEKIGMIVTEVYQACSFQDITGQRITKVVRTLKHIDEKVDSLLASIGGERVVSEGGAPASDGDPDAALMNGPQLPGGGIDQADVDKLFGNE